MEVDVGERSTPRLEKRQLNRVEYWGPIFADICNQERYLVNNTRIELSFKPNEDSFRLMVKGGKTAYLKIEEAYWMICHIDLDPRLQVSFDQLMTTSGSHRYYAKYPVEKCVVRTFRATSGARQIFERDMFQGSVPS